MGQEHQLHSLGCGWSGQDQATLAPLLPEHPGTYLCGRQQRQGESRRGKRRADENACRGRTEGGGSADLRQQAGLPNAMNAAEITDKLGLHSLRNRNWYIQATCATSGDGLYEGLDWLSNQLKNATR